MEPMNEPYSGRKTDTIVYITVHTHEKLVCLWLIMHTYVNHNSEINNNFIYCRSGVVDDDSGTIHPIIQYFVSGPAIGLILYDHMMQ